MEAHPIAAAAESFDAHGLHFRQWVEADVPNMVELFNTAQMDRWTPLPFPFTEQVASAYVVAARQARQSGVVQLAVCPTHTGPALGELLVFPSSRHGEVELAYAIGAQHQRQGVGTRAVLAGLQLAGDAGAHRAVLSIDNANVASTATARACGFSLTDAPARERRRKGYVLMLQTWVCDL